MIRNERQYKVSTTQRDKLALELARIDEADAPKWVINATRSALVSQITDIELELSEYDALKAQDADFAVADLAALPRELVRARIARNMSQRDLAEALGLKEQQIQRYEATDYAGASVARLSEIMAALNVKLTGELNLVGGDKERDRVRRALAGVGLSSATIQNRFFATASLNTGHWMNAATRAARVFRTTVDGVLSGSLSPASSGAFRAHPAANLDKLTGYAIYAEYLAELAVRVCATPYRPLPSVSEIRESLGERLEHEPLQALLDVCWDHGIPVVPLTDSGAFYGACWFFNDRPAIVLKNQVRSPERWAFLLAHEMEHTRAPGEASVLESELGVREWREEPAERQADATANELLLGSDAEAMAQVAVKIAEQSAARLKAAVSEVAEANRVSVGLLADYIAHRVTTNWWATANRLHTATEDAWLVTRSALFSRVELERLDSLDRDILIDGMAP
jgi:transcriptional regulator with XRE-family HTH domain/Zn-dependent peptidase ImmA (M78 family)